MSTDQEKLANLGLDEALIKNTMKNAKVVSSIIDIMQLAKVEKCEKPKGVLIYSLATKLVPSVHERRGIIAGLIDQNKLTTVQQIEIAIEFLKKQAGSSTVDLAELEKACGVGIVVTDALILEHVGAVLKRHEAALKANRYAAPTRDYLKEVRESIPFANGGQILKLFNEEVEKLLGPMTEEEKNPGKKKAAKPKEAPAQKEENKVEEEEEEEIDVRKYKVENLKARDLLEAINTEEQKRKHLEATGGKVLTRFPPEPNGYLHIGHAKAMRFSFMVAKENGGETYLRYDDTNPDKENHEYIVNIEKNVSWLGYKPWKITHASDLFEVLYNHALTLIKKDKAFICEQTKAEMQEARKAGIGSPHRNRPIEESLKMFDLMKKGYYEEGKVMLRLKIDPKHPNPTMRDPVIFRIKYTPHPHAGSNWCIYPVYDFTHCINDSIENITHSLCTLEFEIRRDLYYWILNELNLYKPIVWEYSRLNISHTVLSKRKLHRLVHENIVKGWDDPRIYTLNGLRRRGYTPEAINMFCDIVSVTRRGNENIISDYILEMCLRKDLDKKAKRTMAVIDPIKLTLTNVPEDYEREVEVLDFPKDPNSLKNIVTLRKNNFVERSDVLLNDAKGFFGIAPGKLVRLKYSFVIKVNKVVPDEKGEVALVEAEVIEDSKDKPKGVLHWISEKDAVSAEVRLYEALFTVENPNEVEDYLKALNPNSLKVVSGAKVNKYLLSKPTPSKSSSFFWVLWDRRRSEKRRKVTIRETWFLRGGH